MGDTADSAAANEAQAHWTHDEQGPLLRLSGDWRGKSRLPDRPDTTTSASATLPLRIDGRALLAFDSSLAAALWAMSRSARAPLDTRDLPPALSGMLDLAARQSAGDAPGGRRRPRWLTRVGLAWQARYRRTRDTLAFTGDLLIAVYRALRGSTAMRGEDLAQQLHATGPATLPIVTLISFLVGLIIAYMGAAQLQRLGAQAFMADLVTIGVVREIAALMTGIMLAGRVGAAFAAQIGSMQANEEIDALRALGLNPVEHLVLPRVLAMALMAPLLTTFAAVVGMLAGLLVAVGIFHVELLDYLYRSSKAITLAHAGIGLLKGTVYGVLVAMAGCRQGLHAGRSAQAVGEATTAAVVQAIIWIVIAASALTIAFQRLGW